MDRRVILITGCSSGIGYDAAHRLRDAGWHVFACCRKQSDCDRLAAEGFDSPRLDYQDSASIHAAVAEIMRITEGRLDAVFNNGAFAIPGAVEDIPVDALRAIFEANVFGWHELTRAVVPIMRAQGHGRIVQCSSVLGFVAAPWRGAYTATKHAIEGLTDTLRMEMRDTDIHVILIEPGPITTEFRKNAIRHFEQWVDWENSPRADQYRRELRRRLYEDRGPDRFERPPSAVSNRLIQALEARRPRPRYYVTVPTHLAGILRRIAPTRVLDWIFTRN